MCILYESHTHCQFYIVQGLFLTVVPLEEVRRNVYNRPDFKTPIARPNPRKPAKTNPRIPSTGKP